MLNLPTQFILFDTEFTAWEDSKIREWSGPNEHREIVQIGAIKVENSDLNEKGEFLKFVKPKLNPELSDYFINLTGITQDTVNLKGVNFPAAIIEFKKWCGELPIYSFGRDGEVVKENCLLLHLESPIPENQFHNIRDFFKLNGVPTEGYYSSTIPEAFGVKPQRRGHDALNDVRTILDGLILLKSRNIK